VGGRIIVQQEKISRAEHSCTNYSLRDVQDSAIILNAIRRSFFTKSATAAMFASFRVEFGRPPLLSSSTSSLQSEIENTTYKHLIGSEPLSHKPFCTNTAVSVADRPDFKQNFMATLCSFPPFMTYKVK
jgi:hypothetical protein